MHRILSRALTIAVRRGRITRNVATLVDAPIAAATEIEPLTRDEARRILDVAKVSRNGARWSVALALGIRQGEALGLRWSYINLTTGEIRAWFQIQRSEWQHGCDRSTRLRRTVAPKAVQEELQRSRAQPGLQDGLQEARAHLLQASCLKDCTGHADRCPKRARAAASSSGKRKGKSKLTLQCPPALLALLKAHKKIQAAERLKAGDRWTRPRPGVHDPAGGPIERTEDWKQWKSILKQAGVRDARVHDARHTAATLLIEQGVNIRVVQEILGHTRVTTTERYTHVATLQMRDARDRMDEALWGPG